MIPALSTVGVLFVLWALAHLKLSRPDGEIIRNLHPYRKLMPYVMIGRNESVVYFDTYVNAEDLLDYLKEANEHFPCNVTHACVAAGFVGLTEQPSMNYFTVGKRLYKRKGKYITFSMKRKKKNKKAKLSAVKSRCEDGWTFKDMCVHIDENIAVERSGKKTYADKEFDLFKMIPRPAMVGAQKLLSTLDYFNMLPAGFIEGDGMYTSIFVANLGSVGMDPGYHHLYEWGNCPLFMMVGRIAERPVVENGEVVVRKQMHVRWSYDERIDDGLSANYGIQSVKRALENPYEYLGCIKGDGSDERALDTPLAEDE